MNSVYNKLLDEIKEKHIVDDILQMKAEMEHREKMKPVLKSINERANKNADPGFTGHAQRWQFCAAVFCQ